MNQNFLVDLTPARARHLVALAEPLKLDLPHTVVARAGENRVPEVGPFAEVVQSLVDFDLRAVVLTDQADIAEAAAAICRAAVVHKVPQLVVRTMTPKLWKGVAAAIPITALDFKAFESLPLHEIARDSLFVDHCAQGVNSPSGPEPRFFPRTVIVQHIEQGLSFEEKDNLRRHVQQLGHPHPLSPELLSTGDQVLPARLPTAHYRLFRIVTALSKTPSPGSRQDPE